MLDFGFDCVEIQPCGSSLFGYHLSGMLCRDRQIGHADIMFIWHDIRGYRFQDRFYVPLLLVKMHLGLRFRMIRALFSVILSLRRSIANFQSFPFGNLWFFFAFNLYLTFHNWWQPGFEHLPLNRHKRVWWKLNGRLLSWELHGRSLTRLINFLSRLSEVLRVSYPGFSLLWLYWLFFKLIRLWKFFGVFIEVLNLKVMGQNLQIFCRCINRLRHMHLLNIFRLLSHDLRLILGGLFGCQPISLPLKLLSWDSRMCSSYLVLRDIPLLLNGRHLEILRNLMDFKCPIVTLSHFSFLIVSRVHLTQKWGDNLINIQHWLLMCDNLRLFPLWLHIFKVFFERSRQWVLILSFFLNSCVSYNFWYRTKISLKIS